MPALSINGVTIEISADSFREEIVTAGDTFVRSTANVMFSSIGMRKRRWSFRTRHMESTMANAVRMWVEGQAQSWGFTSGSVVSGNGVAPFAASTTVASFTSTAIQVAAGTFLTFALRNKLAIPNGWDETKGWTIAFQSYRTVAADGVPSDGWYFYTASGSIAVTGSTADPVGVTQTRNGVVGSYGIGRIARVGTLSGVVGATTSGASAAKDYDNLLFLPFQVPSTWVSQLYSFIGAGTDRVPSWSPMPLVYANGDHLDNTSTLVACRVDRVEHVNASIGGVSKPNVKLMDITMEEF